MSPGQAAIVVMAKAPRPGFVKTRLGSILTPQESADLASCFLQDVVALAQTIASQVVIAYAPNDGQEHMASLITSDVQWVRQRGSDLGLRMHNAFADVFAPGFGPIVILGTDSPNLPKSSLELSFDALRQNNADVALGPAEDGGYYLIGLTQPNFALFQDIAWSTPDVLSQTLDNVEQLKLRVYTCEPWYDVDTPSDLQRLREDLRLNPSAAPFTHQWLLEHGEHL